MKKFFTGLMISVAALSASAVTPQAGFWAIDGELNGEPGRGFQMDTSGDVLVFSYYGYNTDGKPTFYLASGTYKNNKFRGDLTEYQGGTALNGPFKTGSELSTKGIIEIGFDSEIKGYMILPGEGRRNISRFTFSNNGSMFNNRTFEGNTSGLGPFNIDPTVFRFSLTQNGQFNLLRDAFFSESCEFTGEYKPAGIGIIATGTFICSQKGTVKFTNGQFTTGVMTVDDDGTYKGKLYKNGMKETHVGISN